MLLLRRGWQICARVDPLILGRCSCDVERGFATDADSFACSSDVDGRSVLEWTPSSSADAPATWRADSRWAWTPSPAPPTWMADPCSSERPHHRQMLLQHGRRILGGRGRLRLLLRRGWRIRARVD